MKNIIFTLIFLLIAAGVSAEEKYDLKTRYPEGTFMETKTESTSMIMDMVSGEKFEKFPMKQKKTNVSKIVAGPIEADGMQKATMELVRMAAEVETMGVTAKFDTDAPEENTDPRYNVANSYIGKKFFMVSDSEGRPTHFGLDESWDELLTERDRENMNSETLTKLMDISRNIPLPPPAAVGDSWPTEMDIEFPEIGKANIQVQNTLRSVELENGVEIATIHSSGTFTLDSGKLKMPPGMTASEMKADVEEQKKIEVKTGLLVSVVSQTKMTVIIEYNGVKTTMEMTAEKHKTVTRQ